MSAAISRSDGRFPRDGNTVSDRDYPALQRSSGCLDIIVDRPDDAGSPGAPSRLRRAFQSGAAKVRFPRVHAHCGVEAVTLNTAGGVTGGDRFSTRFAVGTRAQAVATSAASEKVYRSVGSEPARIEQAVIVGEEATLDWVPQAMIVFDGGRIHRRIEIDLAATARLFAVEALVFGRSAMGERMRDGCVTESWRIRREGRLVYADETRVERDVDRALCRSGVARGWTVYAAGVIQDPAPQSLCSALRDVAQGAEARAPTRGFTCGVGVLNDLVVWRALGADGRDVIRWIGDALHAVRGRALPRSWMC